HICGENALLLRSHEPTTSRGSSLRLFCSDSYPFRHHRRKPSRIYLGTLVCPLLPTQRKVRKVGARQGRHAEDFCSVSKELPYTPLSLCGPERRIPCSPTLPRRAVAWLFPRRSQRASSK